jgi:hypothetical protein
MPAQLPGEMLSAWQICDAFCWIEIVPLAHMKIRFCISTGSSAGAFCCVLASVTVDNVINELTINMIAATIVAEPFIELNQFADAFITSPEFLFNCLLSNLFYLPSTCN